MAAAFMNLSWRRQNVLEKRSLPCESALRRNTQLRTPQGRHKERLKEAAFSRGQQRSVWCGVWHDVALR